MIELSSGAVNIVTKRKKIQNAIQKNKINIYFPTLWVEKMEAMIDLYPRSQFQ